MSKLERLIFDIKKICHNKKTDLHSTYLKKKDLVYSIKALKSSNVASYGNEHNLFESKLKKYTKAKFLVLVSNGSVALKLSLELLNIKKNSEILIPSFNYISAANAVVYHGAIPHFIEINNKLLIDTNKLEDYLNKNTKMINKKCINKKTKRPIEAIICLHNYGHICDVPKIKLILKKFNILIIEDAAEALGSFKNYKHAGTFGDIGVLSFNGNKIITTGGGGALLIRKKKLAIRAKNLINHNKINHAWKLNYSNPGYNFRLPNLNAALGLGQILRINEIVKQKRKIYDIYFEKLKNYQELGFLLQEDSKQKVNYWLQTFVLKNYNHKKKIINKLILDNIYCRDSWKPLHMISFFKKYPKMNLSVTNKMHKCTFNLPSGLEIFYNNKKIINEK